MLVCIHVILVTLICCHELLDKHIRRQRLLKRYGQKAGVRSIPDVRKEAEKILNEFLKKQLRNEIKGSPILSQHYQKVVTEDELEQTEEFDDEYIMKGEICSALILIFK